jgi:DNA-binding response OmpR family regulator
VGDRLLVIDSDSAWRAAYTAHFMAAGFDVQCAGCIGEVLSLPAPAPFDAVIASVGGESAASVPTLERWLACGGPPVVVLTAYDEPSRATDAARLAADAFLHKPPSLVWLEWLLRSRIDASRSVNDQAVSL